MAIIGHGFVGKAVDAGFNDPRIEKYIIDPLYGTELKNLNKELQKLQLRNDIQSKTREDLDQQQREYYLNQQLKTIQEELGGASNDQELEEMLTQSKTKKRPHFFSEVRG